MAEDNALLIVLIVIAAIVLLCVISSAIQKSEIRTSLRCHGYVLLYVPNAPAKGRWMVMPVDLVEEMLDVTIQ